MKMLILDKKKRIKIGQEAYKEVKKNYNMEKVAKSYISILKYVKDEFKGKGKIHESHPAPK
jgi:spore maturation protein CgeB